MPSLSCRLAYALRSALPVIAFLLAFAVCIIAVYTPADVRHGYMPLYSSVPPGKQQSVWVFGIHPLYNPQRMDELFGPIIAFLNQRVPEVTLKLEASRSYAEFEAKLYAKQFHLALPNPYQTITCIKQGYRVFGKWGKDEDFRGIILVRKDSGIQQISELKGKTVSFPAPTALAAAMMPLYYLHTHGLDVNTDIHRLFAGSQESSIMSVYLGESEAGATWPPPWQAFAKQNPQIADELTVKWETPSLVNNSLVVRDDMPDELVSRVAAHLFAMHTHDEGRKLLEEASVSGFERATNETYAPVYDFLEKYNAVIH